uniref:Uncharacterized protein n=1 Tax=Arundo donax TaxID=35708 RepID=A0A0A9BNZ9_ARUDO
MLVKQSTDTLGKPE